jgi:hypothetical protein
MINKIRKKILQIVIISIILGITITIITGFFLNTEKYIGSSRWGYPLPWLSKIIVNPKYSPTLNIIWPNLIINITFISTLIFLILFIALRKKI